MIEVFNKVYYNKFINEVSYYFTLITQGKPRLETIYESVSDYDHYYSKYIVFLNFFPKNKSKIEVEVLTNGSILLNKLKAKRKLAVLTKFIFYIVILNNDFPITKGVSGVLYNNNNEEFQLSVNAFLKSYYKLVPFFNQILNTSSSHSSPEV